MVLTTNAENPRLRRRGKTRQANNSTSGNKFYNSLLVQTQYVSNYVLQLLSGEPMSGSQLGRTLSPAAYVSLLPAIWALLNNTSSAHHQSTSNAILNAVISHSIKTPSKSVLKPFTIEFVARLVLVHSTLFTFQKQIFTHFLMLWNSFLLIPDTTDIVNLIMSRLVPQRYRSGSPISHSLSGRLVQAIFLRQRCVS